MPYMTCTSIAYLTDDRALVEFGDLHGDDLLQLVVHPRAADYKVGLLYLVTPIPVTTQDGATVRMTRPDADPAAW